ncbi:3fc50b48-c167-4e5f-b597-83b483a68904 [Sclerotinia trifoliorum]|uniref:3fc50b48-c167-4e5f-b597-83b483a68904 n=1 Tax=Sclerotinia trifoliorum TaxID=28548 RepID=A0A8H2ZQD4_9HELO|nr:3fc50b48-c167-4e5f-b597-83b483a68904 [Sclerotinia trifoliorum]
MLDTQKEFRTVHRDRRRNIGKLVDGKWVWGEWHKLSTRTAFTSSSSTKYQQSNAPSFPTQNSVIFNGLTIDVTTNLENTVISGQKQDIISHDLSILIMGEKRRQRGNRSISSGGSSSTGTPRPNPPSSFLNSIDTLIATPSFLDSIPPPFQPAVTSPVQTFRHVNILDFPTAERVADSPFMYSPKLSSNEGRMVEKSKPSSIVAKPAGDKSSSLVVDKEADEARTLQNLRYSEWNMEPEPQLPAQRTQTFPKDVQPRIKEAQYYLKDKKVPGATTQKNSEYPHSRKVKKDPSATTKPTSNVNSYFGQPQKLQPLPSKPNNQMPERSRRQTYETVKVDTLPKELREHGAPVLHFNTPPAIKAYRERYLPSIQTGSPTSNKLKMTTGASALELSAPKMGTVLSTLSPKRLFSAQPADPVPAEANNVLGLPTNHPSVTDPGKYGSFQTPGAVPYNLTPSPAASVQENDYYEPYNGRSPSRFDSGVNITDSPPISVNEAAPTSITKIISPVSRAYSADTATPADEEMKNIGNQAHTSTINNYATSAILGARNPDTHAAANAGMREIIDLTEESPVINGGASPALGSPDAQSQRDEGMEDVLEVKEQIRNSIGQTSDMVTYANPLILRARDSNSHVRIPSSNFCEGHLLSRIGSVAERARNSTYSLELELELELESEAEPEAGVFLGGSRVGQRQIINLTLSPTPTSKLDGSPEYDHPDCLERIGDEDTGANLAERDSFIAQGHHFHNRDGRAPSPENFDSMSSRRVPAQNMSGSSEEANYLVRDQFGDSQDQFEVATLTEQNRSNARSPNGKSLEDNDPYDERSPVLSAPSAERATITDIVTSIEDDTSLELEVSGEGDAMEVDESAEVDPSFKVTAPAEGDAMDVDEQLSSDLSDVPSDAELGPFNEESERFMSEKEVQQAVLDALTVSVFPKSPPSSMVDDERAFELAKRGAYFTLAHALFSAVPKEVYDQIWKDEHVRPKISLSVNPPRWIRPLDPTIKHPAKADPSSTEIMKVIREIEKLLVRIWTAVESIVVVLYSDISREFTVHDLDEYFRRYQVQIFVEWTSLHGHLLTLAEWKDRYFAISNIKKRAIRHNANPYARLFTARNPAGILFYGTEKYLGAMKAALADAYQANECVMMKGRRWKHLIGMHKRALGEEYSNCLDGLRNFNTVVRRRDWNVEGAPVAAVPSPMVGMEMPTKVASKEVSSKLKEKEIAVEDDVKKEPDGLSDGDPPYYEAPSKSKGKEVAVEDDTGEKSDDLSDGDPPDNYEEKDDEDDEDYVESRSHLRRRGPKLFVQPPTPRKKRTSAFISRSTSRCVSSSDDIQSNNRRRTLSVARSTSRHFSSDDEMKGNRGRSSTNSSAIESGDELPRGRSRYRAGSVPAPGPIKSIRKGAKRLMVEVDKSSSPNTPKDYSETP